VAGAKLAREITFGGGSALSAVYLHHRVSEDLDFLMQREVEPADLRGIVGGLKRAGISIDQRVLGPRRSLVLSRRGREVGRVDFAFFPFEPIERGVTWRGLHVASLLDMAVDKVQAVLTRFQPRDFVDLLFLLREGPQPRLEKLLDLVRAKFDVGADRLALTERLLLAHEIRDLPRLLRPVSRGDLVAFFEERARELVRRG
jgi:predicted nucleotidyltransferase component of viral defense system